MNYLLPAEYESFGLESDTPESWITAASVMMDAFCKRPGLDVQSYTERLRPGRRSNRFTLTYGPLATVASLRARFARNANNTGELGDVCALFCATDSWIALDATTLDVDTETGEVALPQNLLGARYGEVEITYTAGLAQIPTPLKVACAQIVKNAQATPALNVRASRVDTMQMEYFSDSLLDTQVRSLLRPYIAERLS